MKSKPNHQLLDLLSAYCVLYTLSYYDDEFHSYRKYVERQQGKWKWELNIS